MLKFCKLVISPLIMVRSGFWAQIWNLRKKLQVKSVFCFWRTNFPEKLLRVFVNAAGKSPIFDKLAISPLIMVRIGFWAQIWNLRKKLHLKSVFCFWRTNFPEKLLQVFVNAAGKFQNLKNAGVKKILVKFFFKILSWIKKIENPKMASKVENIAFRPQKSTFPEFLGPKSDFGGKSHPIQPKSGQKRPFWDKNPILSPLNQSKRQKCHFPSKTVGFWQDVEN